MIEPAASDHNPAVGGPRPPVNILIVEDETLLAQFFVDVLADSSYRIVGPGTTLPAALRLAAEELIDVAILDVNLEGQPVTVVADALIARRIPFLFATGFGRLPDARFSRIPILKKPFMVDDLFGGIAALLPERLRDQRLCAC